LITDVFIIHSATWCCSLLLHTICPDHLQNVFWDILQWYVLWFLRSHTRSFGFRLGPYYVVGIGICLSLSVLIRFKMVHNDLGRLKPGTLQCGSSFTNSAFFTPEVLQLFLQISSSELSRVVFSQTGCLDLPNLLIGTLIIYVSRWGLFFTLSIVLLVCILRRIYQVVEYLKKKQIIVHYTSTA